MADTWFANNRFLSLTKVSMKNMCNGQISVYFIKQFVSIKLL